MIPSPQKIISFALFALLSWPAVTWADPYGEALQVITAHQEAGEFEAALALCRTLRESYSQDYRLALLHGWSAVNSGAFDEAYTAYQDAYTLSKGADEATLGLGHVLVEQGRGDEAIEVLNSIEATSPFAEPAQRLRERAQALDAASSFHYAAGGKLLFLDYSGAMEQSFALGSGLGLLIDHSGFVSSLDYTFLTITKPRSSTAPTQGKRNPTYSWGTHHEGFLGLGYTQPNWGIMAHGALLSESPRALLTGLGLTARWTPAGTLLAELNALDLDLWRASLGYRQALGPFTVGAAGNAQFSDEQWLFSGELELGLRVHEAIVVTAFGHLGESDTPLSFIHSTLLNYDERLLRTLGAHFSWELSQHWRLGASWAWQHLEDAGQESDVQVFGLGIHHQSWAY